MMTQVDLKHLSTTKLVELKLMVEKELKFRNEVGEEINRRKISARSWSDRHVYTEQELKGGM